MMDLKRKIKLKTQAQRVETWESLKSLKVSRIYSMRNASVLMKPVIHVEVGTHWSSQSEYVGISTIMSH